MAESSHIVLRLVLAALWVAMLVVTVLAYSGVFKNPLAKAAKENETALTPETYTFYSLALIGILQGLGSLYALFPFGYEGDRRDSWKTKTVNAIGPWWIIGFVCEILWAGLWTQTLGSYVIASFVLQMAGLLSFAIGYGVLMNATADHAKELNRAVSLPSYIFFFIPTAMNLAWLTIGACIGFLTIISNYAQDFADKDGIQILAVILVVSVTFVGMLIEGFHASIFYGLTLIWTISGIYVNKRDSEYEIMEQALLVCLILLCLSTLISIVVSIFRRCRKPDEKEEPLTGNAGEKDDDPVLV